MYRKVLCISVLTVLLALFIACDSSAGYSGPDFSASQENGVDWYLWVTNRTYQTYDFSLYIPDGYDEALEYPIVVCIHGGGGGFSTPSPHPLNELGGGPIQMLFDSNGIFHPERRADLHPDARVSFVVIPEEQAKDYAKGYWDAQRINMILDYMCENYSIDKTRIYLTGGSYGGWASYHICATTDRPDLIPAAIVPMCGGNFEHSRILVPNLSIENFDQIAVWHFHSIDDPVVPYTDSVSVLREITPGHPDFMGGHPALSNSDGTVSFNDTDGLGEWQTGVVYPEGRITLTLFGSGGHGIGDLVVTNTDVWDWLYSQHR